MACHRPRTSKTTIRCKGKRHAWISPPSPCCGRRGSLPGVDTSASEVSAGAEATKIIIWLIWRNGLIVRSGRLRLRRWRFLRSLPGRGGHRGCLGQSSAATQMLRTVIRLESSRASALAIELIDRGVINLSTTIEALVIGGAQAGAAYPLLSAIYGELLSLVDPGSTGYAAVAILNRAPFDQRITAAQGLMSRVRTNSLPSHRIEVARGFSRRPLGGSRRRGRFLEGLQPGHNDSSHKSMLYRLTNGETLSIGQVAARLSRADNPGNWNPNPAENSEFDWWSAVKRASIQSSDHLRNCPDRNFSTSRLSDGGIARLEI